ncbi:MAG: hypothetical protein ACREHD_27450, partial [Pirellulales bacterium]
MHDQLLGYLLGALEPSEQEEVEARLMDDVAMQEALARLRDKLNLLEDGDEFEPPSGLAFRTCKYVAARAAAAPKVGCGAAPLSGWRVQDMIVGGGVFLAACMLIFPAIAHSLASARITNCQNNLRAIGLALGQYSDLYAGQFPFVPEHGPLAVAGIYGPILFDANLLDRSALLVCPTSPLVERRDQFSVPRIVEITRASAAELPRLQSGMGGSYGYTLGYCDNGRYQGHRNRGRAQFALMADAPGEPTGGRSGNHEATGQNVLFEDLHVAWLKQCRLSDCGDHIYVNGLGYVGAGIGADDAVIGHSAARPL